MNDFNKINLIGLVGEAGCGKDTSADYMVEEGWTKFAFAHALKEMCIEYLGLSYEEAYTQEGKLKFNEFWGMTNREILQKVGTDAFRNGFHKDTWVKIAELKISKMLSEGKKVIISDCRFDNEAEMVERLGGIVMKIERNNYKSNLTSSEQNHISEQGVNDKYISRIILNDREKEALKRTTIECLASFEHSYNKVADILNNYVDENKTDKDIAEQFLFNIKKYWSCNVNVIHPRDDNKNIRVEWTDMKNHICILTTNGFDKEIEFKALLKSTINSVEYNQYSFSFMFNDENGWIKINNFINNN